MKKSQQQHKVEGFYDLLQMLRDNPTFFSTVLGRLMPYTSLDRIKLIVPADHDIRFTFIYPYDYQCLLQFPPSPVQQEQLWVPRNGQAIATWLWEGYYAPVKNAA